MDKAIQPKQKNASLVSPVSQGVLQRKSASGDHLSATQKRGQRNDESLNLERNVVDERAIDNRTGLSDSLKGGLESLSGFDLSGVRVHRNSSEPGRVNALAYTQGQDIYVGPGQEKHIPHEGWHVVQQMQGRVQPTIQAKGVSINDDAGLEREADLMGAKALQLLRTHRVATNSIAQVTTEKWGEKESAKASADTSEAIGQSEGKGYLKFLSTPAAMSSPVVVQCNFLGDVIRGAGSYIADLGRGAKRTAGGLKVWDTDGLIKIAEENESAARLLKRLVTAPRETLEETLVVATGGLVTWKLLPDSIRQQALDKFGDAAKKIIQGVIAKQVGKIIVNKIAKKIAIRVIRTAVYKRLAKKLGANAFFSSTGIGIPVALLGLQGVIEKASSSADSLKSQFPAVYNRLQPKDLHMAWFLVERYVPEIMQEISRVMGEMIERASPDGRILVDAGGSNDRVPIRTSESERRVPVRTSESERRVPVRTSESERGVGYLGYE